ncbi:hypothetical protein ACFQZS_06505 [Mucilaginibacter calamicampi]|uniref:Uncharacterized protein n=1 Tax=Mucilaginibacter calamicampi TaxID=1302352 RepID=A0ABW2YV85_9SPHI
MEVPKNWKRVDVKGIDSFVGRIDIDSAKSIGFNMGWYCDNLEEGKFTDYYNIDFGNVYIPDTSKKRATDNTTYWKYFGKADRATIAKVKRQVSVYTNIDQYRAKIVTPKVTGIGITGVYIDSLWKAGDSPEGFVLCGENLTFKQQRQLLSAIKTLRFYQKSK